MGKRSNFERNPRDFYPTPYEAVVPLVPHLPSEYSFYEPCAGNGQLITHLVKHGGLCNHATDIEPQGIGINTLDVFDIQFVHSDYIITNPPWSREILHPMIKHLSSIKPTWLLFDADWMHTKQSTPYMTLCSKIVSVGRIKWFGNMTGKDNCAWYLFGKETSNTNFYGRT